MTGSAVGWLRGVGDERPPPPTWPVIPLALPAAVSIWAGWVGLGQLTGFGVVQLLPGIWDGLRINTAVTLPIGMEAYASYALYVWLHRATPRRARDFARISSIVALALGALGQVAYHLMAAAGVTSAPWPITAAVACLPVGVLGMGATLAHLLSTEPDDPAPTGKVSRSDGATTTVPAGSPAPQFRPAMSAPPVSPGPGNVPPPAQPVAPVPPVTPPRFAPADRPGFAPAVGSAPAPTGQPVEQPVTHPAPQRPTDAQLVGRLREMAERNGGEPPSQYAVRNALGVGGPKAVRLLAELAASEQPAAPPVTNGATRKHDDNQGARNA